MRSIRSLLVVAAILIIFLTSTIRARIHHLRLEDDRREQVTVSTFGFLKNGFLQVRVNQLSFYPFFRLDAIRNSVIDDLQINFSINLYSLIFYYYFKVCFYSGKKPKSWFLIVFSKLNKTTLVVKLNFKYKTSLK